METFKYVFQREVQQYHTDLTSSIYQILIGCGNASVMREFNKGGIKNFQESEKNRGWCEATVMKSVGKQYQIFRRIRLRILSFHDDKSSKSWATFWKRQALCKKRVFNSFNPASEGRLKYIINHANHANQVVPMPCLSMRPHFIAHMPGITKAKRDSLHSRWNAGLSFEPLTRKSSWKPLTTELFSTLKCSWNSTRLPHIEENALVMDCTIGWGRCTYNERWVYYIFFLHHKSW